MKAIVITGIEVNEYNQKLLNETNVLKLAINQHGEIYNPDMRIITDYILPKILNKFPQIIISVREKLRYPSDRVTYPDIEFKGATIISAIEYLIKTGYDEILIVGDNTVHSKEFQNLVNEEITKLISKAKIYQFSTGNFNLPIKTIKDFLYF